MSKLKYEAVATTGEYKDRQTGETKKRYTRVGTVFENDEGQLSLKIDTIPVGPGWSGWISFFPPRENGNHGQQRKPQSTAAPAQNADPAGNFDDEDDIPF